MSEDMIFVGNLPHSATESEIKEHFSSVSKIYSINLITDRKGRSRCFGFLKVDKSDEAVASFNQKEFQGRKLRVSHAIKKETFRYGHRGFHNRGH